jgi:hypothetical protein
LLIKNFFKNQRNMLTLGASMHWSKALEMLTSDSEMKADSLVKYFQPLTDWLKDENEKYQNSL